MRPAPLLAAAALALLVPALADADEPLRPPSPKTECSPGGVICADMDPKNGTIVYRKADGPETPLWAMPGWFRVAFVADDGQHLVTGYDGQNLLARRNPDEVMLRFWADGQLLRSVRLRELLPDLGKLQRTVSHWHWGNYRGFDADGDLILKTVDGRTHHYSVTGNRRENKH